MISLPGSGSELFNARALLLGANRLRLFHWHRGRLSDSGVLEASAQTRADFKAYLAARPAGPVYLLVDLAEEEFRPETVPHARGTDRKALIRRKQARLFGPGARVYAERQGREQSREPGGRRAERLLFMALSGRGLIEPWVELLRAQKVPLQGILSVPALLQSLLGRLPDIAPHALLLTRQSVSGWRQSFFANGQLKASRLGPPADPGGPPATLLGEIEQFRRYLASLRLMPEGQPLDVYVLADPALQRALAQAPGQPPDLRLHDLDLGRLERQRALRPQPGPPCCDRLLLQHLFRTRPANRYASAAERRYARLAWARRAIHAGAVLLLLGGLIHSGLNVINGLGYRQAAAEFAGQAGRYRAAQEQARARLPETAPPGAIRAAVASAARLRQDRATPRAALALLGGALARFPDIRPLTIAWAHDPAMAAPAAADADDASADGPRYRQSLRLEARIEPFAGDYRAAILRVREFARILRALTPVRAVEIEALPLDLSPGAVLQGSGGPPAGAAPFALKALIGAD